MAKTSAEYAKERYHSLRAQRKCVQCGKRDEDTLNGKWRCRACAEKFNKYQNNLSKERAEAGLCKRCGKKSDGHSYCKACREYKAERYRNSK